MKSFFLVFTLLLGMSTTSDAANVIKLTTSKAIGSTIEITMVYSGTVTIEGSSTEPTSSSINAKSYTLTSQELTITGDISVFQCNSQNLTKLDVSGTSKLNTLSCYSNQITELDVSKSTGLLNLSCYSNQIAELDLSKNTKLKQFSCATNKLTSLDVRNNKELTSLTCSSNLLSALDVSQNTELTTLNCYNNQLTALDLTNNTKLTKLSCEKNLLQEIDVKNNRALTYLKCDDNQIVSLDLSENTALTDLLCGSNQLTCLDVSHNTALERLRCESNQLTSLDLSSNTALEELRCESNKLAELSLNSTLKNLYCQSNQLTSLDLSENTALKYLNCSNNQLMILDLSKNTSLGKNGNISGQVPTAKPVAFGEYLAIHLPKDAESDKIKSLVVNKVSKEVNLMTDSKGDKYLAIADLSADLQWDEAKAKYSYVTGSSKSNYKELKTEITIGKAHVQQVSAAGRATFFIDYPVAIPEGISAYYCNSIDEERDVVTYAAIESGQVIPANTPFFVEGNPGYYVYSADNSGTEATITNNIMTGSTTPTTVGKHTVLTLGKSDQSGRYGFWWFTGTSIGAYRSWIDGSYATASNNAKGYTLVFDDGGKSEATGITDILQKRDNTNAPIYNLHGQRVKHISRGIIIRNGRKQIVE